MKHISEKRLVDLYEAGWSLSEIHTRTGRNPSTIYYTLKRHGVQMRPRGDSYGSRKPSVVSDAEVRLTVKLYNMGLSMAEIGERLGVSSGAIRWRLLNIAGIETRNRSEVSRLAWRRGRIQRGSTRPKHLHSERGTKGQFVSRVSLPHPS